jgi:hypothetical protein
MSFDPIAPEQIVLAAEAYLGHWAFTHQSARRTTDASALFYFTADADIEPLVAHQTRIGTGAKTPGKRFRLYLVDSEDSGQNTEDRNLSFDLRPPSSEYGQYARQLKLSAFFRTSAVWRVLGSDAAFREWVSRQPSIVSGDFGEHTEAGERRNIAAHVRRAGESGTGTKAEYACVPMTAAEHAIQHQSGEAAVYARAMVKAGKTAPTNDPEIESAAAAWFDAQRIKTVSRWAWERCKATLGFESMADVPPEVLCAWAVNAGVARYLPECYRRATRKL